MASSDQPRTAVREEWRTNGSDGTILVMQGGGAYGAYECGVYQALAPALDDLVVVAGTSVGAINAAVVATHYSSADRGAAALDRLWREDLATPSIPFFGATRWITPASTRWDAVWTSLLFGNPHLFTPRLLGWPLVPSVALTAPYFYASDAMRRTLEKYVRNVEADDAPRLIVTAVDVKSGESRVFDSAAGVVTAAEVAASGSLPPWLPGTQINGHVYWDGGLWSNTPLPEVLKALKNGQARAGGQSGRERQRRYRIIVVDVWPRGGDVPLDLWQTQQRINELLYADKTDYDRRACERVNRYLEFVWEVERLARELPESGEAAALRRRITHEYDECTKEGLLAVEITVIKRRALAHEDVSREIDFSPERIAMLIQQGREDAEATLPAGSGQAGARR